MSLARAILVALLVSTGLSPPPTLEAQEARGPPPEVPDPRGFRLEQNYPNPINPETWLPFYLEESLFDNGRPVVVSLRVFNVLRQTVAVPTALEHPQGRNVPILELTYQEPGRYIAYWNGRDSAGRRVPSGVYYYQLVVNDLTPQIRRLTVLNPRRRPSIIPWFGTRRDRP